ncbi:hypothetical protein [Streptosporangium lutulentum]|uniref:DUF222 domain-containing protein n=1 Tax=Streptosporangium lutulentum TaxID=1461250 RepID=A0ABT9Q976_9ACTN|nr:hypothetical protein [Streptosporangium lutulentum]MDP9843296.1 hypothetical protein [Streptosporangium lutulentum]
MEDDDTLVAGQDLVDEAQELAGVYQMALMQGMKRSPGDLQQARRYALGRVAGVVAGQAVAVERHRIALALMRRSVNLGPGGEHRMVDLGQGRQRPADDPLVEGLREVVPWRWLRHGMARVIYRVLAEMVRHDQV